MGGGGVWVDFVNGFSFQEPHENGPLFSELSYYRRVAKGETSEELCRSPGSYSFTLVVYEAPWILVVGNAKMLMNW